MPDVARSCRGGDTSRAEATGQMSVSYICQLLPALSHNQRASLLCVLDPWQGGSL